MASASDSGADLVLLDVNMPGGGTSAAEALAALPDAPSVVAISAESGSRIVADMLSAGAVGYLLKDRVLDVADFTSALERVATGGSALDPEVVARLMVGGSTALTPLTTREREVLALMAEGLTNTGIAERLVLAEPTVKTHVSHVLDKLELRDRAQAVVLAYEAGLIRPGSIDAPG